MPAASAAWLDPARVHARLIKASSTDHALYNHLITLYSRTPSTLHDALRLFHRLPFPPDAVSWTAVISAHSRNPAAAIRLLLSMLRRPALPNQGTLSSLLKTLSFSPLPHLPCALQIHALALKLALHCLPFAGSALVHFYSECRRPADALKAFEEIHDKDEVCYGAAVVSLAQNHRPADALSLFASMRTAGIPSNAYAVSAALRAAAHAAALEQARVLHAHAVVAGLDSDLVVGTALVDAYGKSGLVWDARDMFDGLSADANLVTCNAMLAAYAQQGDAQAATELFGKMIEKKFVPDELTFLAILTACSNASLVSEVERWLDLMSSCYAVEPGLEHYTCLVGSLARVGRLVDAEHLALVMPLEPDVSVWRTLLSGCMLHGASELGQTVAQRLLELDPHDDSAYVMLANTYVATGRRDEKAEVWAEMRHRGVKKEGGQSWVELKGEVHAFVSGDRKHKLMTDIYAKLMELVDDVRRLGYEDADEAVWHHSERLAVAFILVNKAAPEGKALRVVKNLRICGDCHEFFNYLSRVIDREIVVRDFNRYHRFQHGACTCRNRW